MMKKVLLAGAVSAVVLTSVVQAKVEHSPYIGLGLGAVGFRNTIDITRIDPIRTATDNPNSNKQAAALGLILGYGFNIDSFHVAAELDYYYNSSSRAKSSVNIPAISAYSTGVSSNGAFGAALRLGYWLSQNHLIYLRGGVEVRRFDFNTDVTVGGHPNVSSHDTRLAFTPGLGFEMKLNDNLSLNLEARMAYYSSKERSATNALGATTRGKYRPHVDSALLSVRYKIGPLFS